MSDSLKNFGDELESNLDNAEIEAGQAALSFKDAILNALKDVYNQIIALIQSLFNYGK